MVTISLARTSFRPTSPLSKCAGAPANVRAVGCSGRNPLLFSCSAQNSLRARALRLLGPSQRVTFLEVVIILNSSGDRRRHYFRRPRTLCSLVARERRRNPAFLNYTAFVSDFGWILGCLRSVSTSGSRGLGGCNGSFLCSLFGTPRVPSSKGCSTALALDGGFTSAPFTGGGAKNFSVTHS